ncbi:MAG: D-alanine--D-alanine ligase [Candidatus Bipolaricaulota bacterium]|nr:D-alanine--D-alanine ligase [Candidatus Bipolaricaulota bacterium]MDW8126608.1 D-alanine--D-alanine ligase [Candidatus Bipolaricaulota bacterium]
MGIKIAVLCGGNSAEREISLKSGRGVYAALRRKGWDVELIEIDTFDGLPQRLKPYTVVFNILHGGPGEDGTVQLLLELMGKAYVGSGPLASALAMDKVEAKKAFQGKNLPTPPWIVYQGGEPAAFAVRAGALGFPLVLKPRREGSSVGVKIVSDEVSLLAGIREMAEQFQEFFVEKYVPGREITAAILEREEGPVVLPLVELRPKREFFDWTAKYTPGQCDVLCPAPLSAEQAQRVADVAREAYLLLGCRDFARLDLRLGEDGVPYLLEVNTLPGMTEVSLFPRAAAAAGLSYEELVDFLVRRALNRLSNS